MITLGIIFAVVGVAAFLCGSLIPTDIESGLKILFNFKIMDFNGVLKYIGVVFLTYAIALIIIGAVKKNKSHDEEPATEKYKNYAAVSLLLGLMSASLSFIFTVNILGVICGTTGIVLAALSSQYLRINNQRRGLSKAGLAVSICGLVLSTLSFWLQSGIHLLAVLSEQILSK